MEGNTSTDFMDKFMAMMQMMERSRLESEDRFLKLLERQSSSQSQTQFQVMPDFSQSIENFDGESLGKKAMDWLKTVESAALLHKWPEEFKLETAKIHLVGTAKKWYIEKAADIRTFDDFKTKFTKTFNLKVSKDELWEKMRKRIQGKSESVSSYFHDKVMICQTLGYDFEDTKEQLLIDLNNKDIIPGLIAAQIDNFDDLLHEIVRFERIYSKSNFNKSQSYQKFGQVQPYVSHNFQKRSYKGQSDRQHVTSLSELPSTSEREPVNIGEQQKVEKRHCFRCKERGHLKIDCPKKKLSHIPSGDPESQTINSENLQSLVHGPNDKNDSISKFIRQVYLNDNFYVTAFIDPGSAVCTIKTGIVEANILNPYPVDQKLYGFGSNSPVCCTQAVEIKIALDEVEEEVEALVVPNDVQTLDLVIGRTFTELPSLAYVRMEDCLHFGYKNGDPFREINLSFSSRKKTVFVDKAIKLERNRINFVQVRIGDTVSHLPLVTEAELELKENHRLGEIRGNSDIVQSHETSESSDVKSPSARTITLRSSESAATPEGGGDDHSEQSSVAHRPEETQDEEQAATRIQAAFRGHQTRKSMKQPAGKVEAATASSGEPTRQQLEEEFRLDDKELCNAATKIQASFRGHMTRKQEAEKKTDSAPSDGNDAENEDLDIDLTDPDLNKAAVKIQASFRGHMVRKEGETHDN